MRAGFYIIRTVSSINVATSKNLAMAGRYGLIGPESASSVFSNLSAASFRLFMFVTFQRKKNL